MPNWKNKPKNNVLCPRCNSETDYYGFNPRYGKQKYCCKKCFHQFTPDTPKKIHKAPKFSCPKCGAKMYIFKFVPDGMRLRCSQYQTKGKEQCKYKINLPLPGKSSFNISYDALGDINSKIKDKFYWSRMHYPKETVSLALFFMVFCSLDASLTSFILANVFGVSVSHDRLNRWFRKSALTIHKNLGPLPIQDTDEIHTDETVFKANGRKKWLWFTKDYTYDSIQSWLFSHRRATEFARSLLARAYKASPCISQAKIISNGLWSYGSAIGDLKDFSLNNHIVYKDFKEPVNNNRLERHWSTLKTVAKRFRGFKSMLGLWSFVTLQVYYHNYFKPNKRLNGLTSASATGMPLPAFKSIRKLFMHLLK